MSMKKNLFFAAIAITALASCSSNDFVGDESPHTSSGTVGAINFNMNTAAITRGSSTDAGTLSNQFIVWGEKNEDQSAAGAAPTDGNLVFKNYLVKYTENTANQTTSNTNNWEYVGISATSNENTNISPNSGTGAQTIKYWDNDASSYTFTAISAKPADITAGRVTILKNPTGTDVYQKGYSVTLAKDGSNNYPSLTNLYFADRINIAKGSGYTHNAVEFSFRNVLSHVRVGMYETIPGYEISEIKFYKADGTTEYNNGAQTPVSAFGAVCPNVNATNFAGTVNVTYYDAANAAIQNQPKIEVTPDAHANLSNTNLVLGTNFSTLTVGDPTAATPIAEKFLSTSATTPTYDTDGGAFTSVLPQVNNTTPLQLKVNYKLYNIVTKEIIQITGKTAEIPGQYLQWKANYKYTYLFKITDDDLTPITFDALVVENAIGNAEYITTVSEPSITTFGVTVNSSGAFKEYQKEKNEYQIPGGEDKLDIYATFMEGSAVLTPQLTEAAKANFVKVYAVKYKDGATDDEKTAHPITELSVANAIEHTGGLITATHINTSTNDYFTAEPTAVTTVPGEDGNNKDVNALKLQGAKADGKYAVEIVTYTEVTLTSGADLNGYYSVDSSNGTYSKETSGTYSSGTYYKQVKTYKVITVVAAL